MKNLFALIVALLVCGAANSQVLYRISGNGLENPSYILGTCHVVGGSFFDTIPGLRSAMAEVKAVCGELDNSDMQNPDTVACIREMCNLPGDSTLRDLMVDGQYERLCKVLSDSYGLDLAQPQYAQLLKLRPLMFSITVASLGEMMKAQKEGRAVQSEQPMDFVLQAEAAMAGMPCIGLETSTFQIRLLMDMLNKMYTPSQQIDNMIETFGNIENAMKEVQNLVSAYKSLEFAKIEEVITQSLKESKDAETLVLTDRNRNWSKQMPAIMASQPTLFAVGFAHLVGNESILSLLASQGYTVEPVK